LRLIQFILEGNAAEFQKGLYEALVDHKQYWSHKERQFAPEGWISLPLAATCAVAMDTKQFKIEVESPYIPSWLYRKK
jgi:Immunity protein 49